MISRSSSSRKPKYAETGSHPNWIKLMYLVYTHAVLHVPAYLHITAINKAEKTVLKDFHHNDYILDLSVTAFQP